MKTLSIVLLALFSLPSFAVDKAEMMKKFMEASTPGEQQKRLSEVAGKWSYVSKMWETADAKPEESKGTSTFKMILGGRFLQQDFKGKAMGMPFEGMGLWGYDNTNKQYQSIWLDSFSTAMMVGAGGYDETTKAISQQGEFSCPMSKTGHQKYRTEWAMTDKKHMTFTMFGPPPEGGKEFKMMEITYTR